MLLNTLNSHTLLNSLQNIFNVDSQIIKSYISTRHFRLSDIDNIDIDHFIKYLSAFKGQSLTLPTTSIDITIFHLTSRVTNKNLYETTLFNLHDALLNPTEVFQLFYESRIEFKQQNDQILVYLNGQKINWHSYKTSTAQLIINRLEGNHFYLKDSTINGFLFFDKIVYHGDVEHLVLGPEIVQNIFEVLKMEDKLSSYQKKLKVYIIGFKVPSHLITFDKLPMPAHETNRYLLKCTLKYLADDFASRLISYDNPMIRLPENLNIFANNIMYVYEFDPATDTHRLL